MPIDRKRYPKGWRKISYHIRFVRAGGKCEQCEARHGEKHPTTGATVELHTAHLDHNPANCADENLKCLCHVCHLQHDRRDNWRKRWYGKTGKFYKQLIIFHEDQAKEPGGGLSAHPDHVPAVSPLPGEE